MKKKSLAILAFTLSLSAESITYTEYVNVRSSHAEYQNVSSNNPYQECYDKRVPVSYSNNYNNLQYNDRVATSVIGGAIGGIIGHQIGRGKGNDAATIGGAVLGTLMGSNIANAQRPYRPQHYSSGYETRRECVTKYHTTQNREFVGYKNIGYYKGKKIVKYSDQRLSQIPVTVTISY
jgi:uncharacterized protein YcfJ